MKYIMQIMPALLSGTWLTLRVFFWTLIVSLPLGVLVAVGELSKFKPLEWLVRFYVWIMRGTPLLLQLIFVFYGLPLIGIVFPRYQAALFAFILNYAAYFAEIFRAVCKQCQLGSLKRHRSCGWITGRRWFISLSRRWSKLCSRQLAMKPSTW